MNTKALRQKILDLAIHGKLVPQDPNDESASVLLERIRDEKERLIKEGKIKHPKKSKTTSDKPHYPYQLPEGWVWCKLDDYVLSVTDGDHQAPPKSSNGVPFLVISNIATWKIDFTNTRYVPKEYYENINEDRKAKRGDILFSVTGSYGIVVNVKTDQEFCFQRHIGLIKPVIGKEYLSYILMSGYIKGLCDNLATGTAQKTVGLDTLRSFFIPIAPIQEQKRIVAKIKQLLLVTTALECGKNELQTAIKQVKSKILDLAIHGKLVPQDPTDEPASELLKRINPKAEIISDNGHYQKLPEGWTILKVGNVAEYINGRAFKPEEWEQTGLPIIRIQNLNDPNAYYNRTKNEYEEKYLIKKGDLLFAWAASLGTYIWKGEDAWLNQHIFKVIPYPFMDKKYLYYAFHAMITEFYRKSHGSGMIHITRKQFEEITLWLPPLTEQYRIVQYLQQVFEKLDSIVENL